MNLREMIEKLEMMYAEIGDVEVLVTDGWDCRCYRGSFLINRWDEDGKSFVDIGIGGLIEN